MPAGIGRSVIKFWSINVVGFVQDPVRFSNQMVEFVRLNSESKVARTFGNEEPRVRDRRGRGIE